ncbi:MAG: RecQ family ATP-dependent DNA helicase [Asticcacaulis sp.]
MTANAVKIRAACSLEAAEETLRRVFGFEAFRDRQAAVIEAVLAGHDVLAVLPTGGGKSLCYQIPAILKPGLGLVISPLIALMSDQVTALQARGVRAARFDSSQSLGQRDDIWEAARNGGLDLLYLSPEALSQPFVRDRLSRMQINLVAIDEAHCISQWGHDFRTEYRALGQVKSLFPGVPTLALTATADHVTRADIRCALHIDEAQEIVASFDRPNLSLRFVRRKGAVLKEITALIGRQKSASGIIYCGSRDGTGKLAEALGKEGFSAAAYHAGLSAEVREKRLRDFMTGKTKIMVATIAFGMGINKADVRFVIHADPPSSMEAYWQEVGRAGRDGKPASGVCFHAPGDLGWAVRRLGLRENEGVADQTVQKQKARDFFRMVLGPDCRRQSVRRYFGEDAGAVCGTCDNCLSRDGVHDVTEPAQMLMSALYRFNGPRGRKKLIDHVLGKSVGHDYTTRMKTFGVARDYPADLLVHVLDQCEAQGLIEEELYDGKMPIVGLKDAEALRTPVSRRSAAGCAHCAGAWTGREALARKAVKPPNPHTDEYSSVCGSPVNAAPWPA